MNAVPLALTLATGLAAWLGGWVSGAVAGLVAAAFSTYYYALSTGWSGANVQRLVGLYVALPVVVASLAGLRRRVRALQARDRARRQEVEAEHTRLIALIESISDGFFALDHSWRYVYANREAERLVGRDRGDLVGKSIWDCFPPLVGSVWDREFHRAVAQQAPAHFEGFYPPLAAWFETHAYPSDRGLTILMRSINERKEAEETRRRLAVAEAGLLARDEVVGMVVHDLRGPLHAIEMSAFLLKRTLTGEAEGKLLSVIERQFRRMERLIGDLLNLAQIEAGSLVLNYDSEDVAPLLHDSIEAFEPSAHDRSLSLECRCDRQLGPVRVDSDRLLEVLDNLIGNALKFTPGGGTVRLEGRGAQEGVHLCVSNTGAGIPPEELPHVFERFWRARPSERGGVGLGLAIVKGIVEAHHGQVWAESEPGKGAAFHLLIPWHGGPA